MTSGPPAIHVAHLSKRFETGPTLDDVSFEVGSREFVTVVGPSGCGKSTTLRIVAGLVGRFSGTVHVAGREVTGPISQAAMVFQSPVLLPWRRVDENILFPAEMRGDSPDRYRERASELTALAGLGGFERRYPHELSGGMQQRVALCRALLLDPALLLMDEPFGALDVLTREHMDFELQRVWSSTTSAVLLVTHSISEAVLLSDRVIVMSPRPGRIHAVVDVDLPRPRSRRTFEDARFAELAGVVRAHLEARWAG